MADSNGTPPDDDAIRARAYALWQQDGEPGERHEEFWHRARAELTQGEAQSGSLDDQLADSFPASDPLSMTSPTESIEGLPKAPEDEPAPARSATLEDRPATPPTPRKPLAKAAAAKTVAAKPGPGKSPSTKR